MGNPTHSLTHFLIPKRIEDYWKAANAIQYIVVKAAVFDDWTSYKKIWYDPPLVGEIIWIKFLLN